MQIDSKLIERLRNSFDKGKNIRRNLPMNSKLVIEQKLPYICVYRFTDTPQYYVSSLVKTQGAYLIAHAGLDVSNLLSQLIKVAIKDFKSYMVVEIWDRDDGSERQIEIRCPVKKISATVKTLQRGFEEFNAFLPDLKVSLKASDKRHPDQLNPLLPLEVLKKTGTLLVGIAIPPLFIDPQSKEGYALFFREIRRKFARIIKQAAYEFVRVQSDNKFEHYLMLGKTQLDNLIRSADSKISEISEKMEFLLRVTPVNSLEEWKKFNSNNFSKNPNFTYRLISIDPEIEKRKLFDIPIEKIDHPTIAFLLRDKRMELEKQLIMLEERGTIRFCHTSQSIFGPLGEEVIHAAKSMLTGGLSNEEPENNSVNAETFARAAEAELDKYRPHFPELDLKVKIKDNVSGLLVSGPELSVGQDLNISESRMNALIQHEVGTHILTYCNGHKQPLHLMHCGFAGYEQTQEGIAVLAEYLVGGLDNNRLKLLAGRVLAVNSLIHGADFIETFNMLLKEYCFSAKTAFNISMRVHRGGGYTKDAIYLKGLMELLTFIKKGGDIRILYAGKFDLKHLPLIEELSHVGIIAQPELPDFLDTEQAEERLNHIKAGIELNELVYQH